LVFGVGAAIYFSARDQLAARRVVTVRGLIGSEDFHRNDSQRLLAHGRFLEEKFQTGELWLPG
jgi:hypothetical protein